MNLVFLSASELSVRSLQVRIDYFGLSQLLAGAFPLFSFLFSSFFFFFSDSVCHAYLVDPPPSPTDLRSPHRIGIKPVFIEDAVDNEFFQRNFSRPCLD